MEINWQYRSPVTPWCDTHTLDTLHAFLMQRRWITLGEKNNMPVMAQPVCVTTFQSALWHGAGRLIYTGTPASNTCALQLLNCHCLVSFPCSPAILLQLLQRIIQNVHQTATCTESGTEITCNWEKSVVTLGAKESVKKTSVGAWIEVYNNIHCRVVSSMGTNT